MGRMKNALSIILLQIFIFSFTAYSQDTKVLYIGDSQTEGFLGGYAFHYLKENFSESEINIFGVGSSSPRHWSSEKGSRNGKWLCERRGRHNSSTSIPLKDTICSGSSDGESIFSHLNKDKPRFVIFQFLGNSMGFSKVSIKRSINRLLKNLDNQDCLFVTSPPYYHELKERNQLRLQTEEFFIEAIGERCEIYRGMSEENLRVFASNRSFYARDLIHLSRRGALAFFHQFKNRLPKKTTDLKTIF